MAAIEQQTLNISQHLGLTLDDAWSEFFVYQRSMRHTPRTIGFYEETLARFYRWLEGQGFTALASVDGPTIRRFQLGLAESGLADTTVHNHMRAVRAFFRFLDREELIERNPMRNVRMPKVEKKILPSFTPEEVDRLLKETEGKDFANVRNRALVLLLLDSGLRLAECASLRLGDIDKETGAMKVMGKGRKERYTRVGAKSLRYLLRYFRLRGGSVGDPLWLGARGPMTQAGIAETLEKLGKRAGVHAHPHKFRRTCALMLLRNGADVFSVQHLLGHADLTVLRRYLAQTTADVMAVHEKCCPLESLRV